MFISTRKPPLKYFLFSLERTTKSLKPRAETPNYENYVKFKQSELKSLRDKVYRVDGSGFFSPQNTSGYSSLQSSEYSHPSDYKTLQKENIALKQKIEKLEKKLEVLRISNDHEDFYEKKLQNEIKNRLIIEKKFAEEAEEISNKLKILEEGVKIKICAENMLEEFLIKGNNRTFIDKELKTIIKKAYGDRVLGLINVYEKTVQNLENEKNFNINRLLSLVLPNEDKNRVIKFINDGDFESAACVVKNLRNIVNLKVPRKLEVSVSPKSQKSFSRPGSPIQIVSLGDNKKTKQNDRINTNDFINFLQCQGSIIENLLID